MKRNQNISSKLPDNDWGGDLFGDYSLPLLISIAVAGFYDSSVLLNMTAHSCAQNQHDYHWRLVMPGFRLLL